MVRRAVAPSLDEGSVERAALRYLERFPTSSAHLARVLMRRAAERTDLDEEERASFAATVSRVVERLSERGLLDDQAYARALAGSLARRGTSGRGIREKLRSKGVSVEHIDGALSSLVDEGGSRDDVERAAAIAYAAKRRLGRFRQSARREHRERDLAALARRGFSFAIARAVVDDDADAP